MGEMKLNFRQAIKAYYSGKTLSEARLQTLQNIQQQIESVIEHSPRNIGAEYSAWTWSGAVAASLIIFVVVFAYFQTPTVINDAYADIRGDDIEYNGLQASLVQWLETNHISTVPEQYKIEMSKTCYLGEFHTKHLRIAGVEQGKLHLFFHRGNKPPYWINRSGVKNDMSWKLMKLRDDLTLIVMYTHDMREKAIKHIMSQMLSDLQA